MDRSLPLSKGDVRLDMKYFITRTTILQVYREALKLAYTASNGDATTRDCLLDMMKDEFRPFRQARDRGAYLTQDAVDYNLAKVRKRINELNEMLERSR